MIPKPKKRKINPLLMKVLLISGAAHVVAIVILGGITIVKYVIPTEAQFEEPPAVQEETPPPDVKVEIKPQVVPQQQHFQNLAMKQVGSIAVADVSVSLPTMEQSFTVSSGLGGIGTGGGSLLGGTSGSIGLGMSDVSVLGVKARAERILFAIDAGREMVIDNKGGLNSYKVIKDEITDMVSNLAAGTLFNVMIYDRRKVQFFKPQLVPAGSEVSKQLANWIHPVNATADKVGVQNAQKISLTALPQSEVQKNISYSGIRQNETMEMVQLALEQKVDAIFFITGYQRGFERIQRRPTEQENKDWQRTTSKSAYKKQLEEHKVEIPQMEKRIAQKLAEINKERQSNGLPPRILSGRFGVYSKASELGLRWTTPHPGWQPQYFIEARDVERHFRELLDVLYTEKDLPKPSVNVVLFLAEGEQLKKEWEDGLEDFVRFFSGKHRIIRGQDEIKNARSAKGTRN